MKLKYILFLGIFLCFATSAGAKQRQSFSKKTDTVVTAIGEGETENEALNNALSNALEQAYGSFVSSSTEIKNDSIVVDDISYFTRGNYKNYQVLSRQKISDHFYKVAVRATVTREEANRIQVINAQKKALIYGSQMVMDIDQIEMKIAETRKAYSILLKKLAEMLPNAFDFIPTVTNVKKDPYNPSKKEFDLDVSITITNNENTQIFFDELFKTLNALNLSPNEIKNVEDNGFTCFETSFYTCFPVTYQEHSYFKNPYNNSFNFNCVSLWRKYHLLARFPVEQLIIMLEDIINEKEIVSVGYNESYSLPHFKGQTFESRGYGNSEYHMVAPLSKKFIRQNEWGICFMPVQDYYYYNINAFILPKLNGKVVLYKSAQHYAFSKEAMREVKGLEIR